MNNTIETITHLTGDRIEFRCRVVGVPQPQGSARAFVRGGRPIVTSANPKNGAWRDSMSCAFAEAIDSQSRLPPPLFDCAVEVSAMFVMPRTKTMGKKGKPHTVKPDCDKLIRSLCDSLSESQVIRDDCLIVSYAWVTKRYADIGEQPGVVVEVRTATQGIEHV